ncbi:MAG: GAF domain-containing protein [Anaerolineae bacterium]|nr:GAF domain-containing protein [Anaerolineae bacterium]
MNSTPDEPRLQQTFSSTDLLQAGLNLLAELDLNKLLQKTMRLVADMLQTDIGGLYLCQPGQERLQIAATIRVNRLQENIELARGEGLAGKVWERGETIIVEDYASWHGRVPHLVPIIGHRALAGFPLQRAGDMLGILLVAAPSGYQFTPAQIQLLKALAAQAAVAIENARLFETWQAAKTMAESLQEVALILNSGLEMRPLLIRILQQLRRVIPYDSAGIFLREGNDLVHYGSSIFGEPEEGNFIHQPYDDPTYYPLYTRRPYVISDVRQDLNWHLNWDWEHVRHIRSWMAMPLLEENDVIGVITTDSFTVDTYDEKSAQIAQSFVNQAVAAIRNARLYKEAQQAREAAETANRAKSQFLATLSHELRTPLGGVLGYARLLKQDKSLTERQQRQVSIIEQSGHHLLMLINDLLDLAKIEAGRFELLLAPFELSSFLQHIGEMILVRAEEKGLAFGLEAHNLPTAVIGDEKRLRQVLINLLGNAVKFTLQGQVSLRVVQIDPPVVAPAQVWLRFTVEDTGIGIKPAYLHRIFEPFHQLGEPQERAEGTGLGLAISHSLIEQMGGQLEVNSVVGTGSKFSFTLPLPLVGSEEVDTAVSQLTAMDHNFLASIPPTAVPSLAELNQLYAQTLQGDISALRHTVDHLAQTNPQYQPFLHKIQHMAYTFQVNELQKLLSTFLSP